MFYEFTRKKVQAERRMLMTELAVASCAGAAAGLFGALAIGSSVAAIVFALLAFSVAGVAAERHLKARARQIGSQRTAQLVAELRASADSLDEFGEVAWADADAKRARAAAIEARGY